MHFAVQKRERREYLEREYRYRLRQEQGLPTPPEEFAPPGKAPAEAATDDDDGDGGSEYDLGTELRLCATLTETTCYVHPSERGLAEMLLRIKAKE